MARNKIFVLPSRQGESSASGRPPQTACKTALIFKPLIWMLSISATMKNTGVLCDGHACSCSDVDGAADSVKRKTKGKFRRCLNIFYMVTAHTVVWTMTLKMWSCLSNLGISFENLESQLYITFLLLTSTSSVMTTAMTVKFSSLLPNIPPKLCRIHLQYGIEKDLSLSIWSKLGALLLVVLLFMMIVTCFGVLLKPDMLSVIEVFMVVIVCPFHNQNVPYWSFLVRLWFNLSNAIAVFAMYLTCVIFIWFCRTVSFLFDQSSLKLRQALSRQSTGVEPNLSLRQIVELHRDVCDLMCLGNDMFKHFFLSVYCMTLPSICFNMNVMLKSQSDMSLFIPALMSVFIMVGILLFIVIPTSLTNAKVLQIREDLYKLNLKEVDEEDFMLASVFATRLTGSTVGFTVSDIFLIDRGHILTLLSILLTYTVLLVQFDVSSSLRYGNNNNNTMF